MKIYLSLLISLIFLLNSCSVSSVKFSAIQPADITIPDHINKFMVFDRSAPSKGNQAENILDGLLSGETIGLDSHGAEKCVLALEKSLNNSPRFLLIENNSTILKGTGTSEFPPPLKWKKIQKITKDYDVDALIILETFDSSSSFIDLGLITQRVKKNGKWVKIPKNKVALDIEVQAGWRVYDILNQKIIDEKRFIDRKKIESVGNSFLSAKKKLPSLHSAVSDAAFFSGEQFYLRISPNYIIIDREYYKNLKGIKGFKIKDDKSNYFFTNASKKVQLNDWEGATEIWKKYVNHENKHIAGRACYNMALACEANGKILLAIDWIKKSINLNNKKAANYLLALKKRKQEQKILEQQLK
tara:strand:- start:1774 stop:2844 length:1071 start_codon:yes stop_codon:yes gene_type:complete